MVAASKTNRVLHPKPIAINLHCTVLLWEYIYKGIWHKGLLYKLKKLDIPDYLIHLIKTFLDSRKLRIKINNAMSDEFTADQGVPQGSPLSPLLFNIYCYDIFTPTDQPINTGYMLQYADDTALVAHDNTLRKTVAKIQILCDDTQIWFNKWRLRINPDKSQLLIFNHTPSNSSPSVNISNSIVRPVSNVKYLGFNLDNKLNMNLHTKMIKRKIISRAKHFRMLTYKNKGINISVASKIYKSICRPMIEYGHTLYLNCRKTALKNIQVAETSSLRVITKIRHPANPLYHPSNELLYNKTKILPIIQRLPVLSTKFAKQAHNLEKLDPLLLPRTEVRPKYKHPTRTIQEILTSLAQENN